MDSSPSDLTLDYTPNGNGNGGGGGHPMTPKQAPPLVQEQHHLTAEQASATTIQKLQEFLSRLDDERLKIDAFKRELPLCMQLLNQAMEAYRQQLEACQMGSSHGGAAAAAARAPLVLEEFIPLSKNIVGADAADQKTATENPKASWMVSAQLWNGPPPSAADAPATPKERAEHPPLDGGRGNGGAFLPFTKEMMATTDHSPAALLPELALAPGAEKDDAMVGINNGLSASGDKKPYLHHDAGGGGNIGNLGVARRDDGVQINGSSQTTTAAAEAGQAQAPQTNRKARRCWSPELHRRFVNALQILGGAQVATPKQIRELMKVDGLTNDEVKSHLQKYRLHTRRPMQAPTAPPAGAPQLVVLGGIWMPPDYAAQAAAAGPAALYGAHPATQTHYTAAVSSAAAQEYYHSAAAHHHHLQQHHHHPHPAMAHGRAVAVAPPAAAYKVHHPAAAAASPESEGRGSGGGRERSESIEEEGEGEDEEDDEDGLAADADADEIKY